VGRYTTVKPGCTRRFVWLIYIPHIWGKGIHILFLFIILDHFCLIPVFFMMTRGSTRALSGTSTPSWVLVLQSMGLSCMAGPLTGVIPAARAMSRQRGRAQHPFLGAGATVQVTQLHSGFCSFDYGIERTAYPLGQPTHARPSGKTLKACDRRPLCALNFGGVSPRSWVAVNHDLPCPGSVCRECVHGWA
jgi:hypothetical protein